MLHICMCALAACARQHIAQYTLDAIGAIGRMAHIVRCYNAADTTVMHYIHHMYMQSTELYIHTELVECLLICKFETHFYNPGCD